MNKIMPKKNLWYNCDFSEYDYWQMCDENMVRIAHKLNDNCLSKNRKTGYHDSYYSEFEPSDLDYDNKKCKDYCYKEDTGYCNQFSYILCESCEKILEEEIRFKYNKTKKEFNEEIEDIKNQLENIKNKLNLISLQI